MGAVLALPSFKHHSNLYSHKIGKKLLNKKQENRKNRKLVARRLLNNKIYIYTKISKRLGKKAREKPD